MARPKGAQNKVGADIRENILAVFTRLGSTAAMADWAREHQTEFYKMYGSLATKEINATVTYRDETTLTDEQLIDIAAGRSAGTAEEASGSQVDTSVH